MSVSLIARTASPAIKEAMFFDNRGDFQKTAKNPRGIFRDSLNEAIAKLQFLQLQALNWQPLFRQPSFLSPYLLRRSSSSVPEHKAIEPIQNRL